MFEYEYISLFYEFLLRVSFTGLFYGSLLVHNYDLRRDLRGDFSIDGIAEDFGD